MISQPISKTTKESNKKNQATPEPLIESYDSYDYIECKDQVKECATKEQTKNLEDREIIDDELQSISITNRQNSLEARPIKTDKQLKAFTKIGHKKGGRKAKKGLRKKIARNNEINRQKKDLGQIHKRKVTLNQQLLTMNIDCKNAESAHSRTFNNSENQENHSWPSLGMAEVPNENDIDRRTRQRF